MTHRTEIEWINLEEPEEKIREDIEVFSTIRSFAVTVRWIIYGHIVYKRLL